MLIKRSLGGFAPFPSRKKDTLPDYENSGEYFCESCEESFEEETKLDKESNMFLCKKCLKKRK